MQIKEVCKLTGLTPRTVRFYIEKGLIDPKITEKTTNEYREYAEEDVKQLIHILHLRKLLFPIQDIKEMLENPDKIGMIVEKHKGEIEKETQTYKDVLECLFSIDAASVTSVEGLVGRLKEPAGKLSLPAADVEPDFGRFDTETEEEKENAYLDFMIHQRIRERINKFLRPFKIAGLSTTLVILAAFLVVLISGIPRKIDRQYTAVQYRYNEEGYTEKTNITIRGKLYKRLLSDPKFVGSIIIDNLDYTRTYELIDIGFHKDIRNGWGVLSYSTVRNGMPEIEMLGSIWIEGNFDKITIFVFEPLYGDSKSSSDLVISAPADTREEAVEITEQLGHMEFLTGAP